MKTVPKIYLNILISSLFLVSAESMESSNENAFVGIWNKKGGNYNDGFKYSKEEKFKSNQYGIQFKADHSVIRRRPSIDCGMGSQYFMDFKGTWNMTSDSTLTIRYSYYNDTKEEDFEIISVSESKLIMKDIEERTIFAD